MVLQQLKGVGSKLSAKISRRSAANPLLCKTREIAEIELSRLGVIGGGCVMRHDSGERRGQGKREC